MFSRICISITIFSLLLTSQTPGANVEMEDLVFKNDDIFSNKSSSSSSSVTDTSISSAQDVPSWLYFRLMGYLSYGMVVVTVFGIIGNALIIITYTKIGFSESINISYCGLGVSDCLCVTCITWNAICFIPTFSEWDLPIIPSKIGFGAIVDIFNLITAWITAFISLERCLCVVFPFKIKDLATGKRTFCVVTTIFLMSMVPLLSIYFNVYKFEWNFNSERNRSLLGLRYSSTPLTDKIYNVYYFKKIFLNFVPLVLILVCSIFLAIQLRISAKWRLRNSGTTGRGSGTSSSTDDAAHKRKYSRDMRTAKTVLAIAVAFIFLGNLNAGRHLIALVLPEFRPNGAYGRRYRLISRLSFLFLQANSSVNFIIYYKMGTKFRKAVNGMICQHCSKPPGLVSE